MRGLLILLLFLTGPAFAYDPVGALPDAGQEARARALFRELRCMVCQNQSIDDSDAPLARDLRMLVRERVAAGDGNDEIKRFLVARYGDFVLLKPGFNAKNLILWGAPLLALLAGGLILVLALRRRPIAPEEKLSPEEQKRLRSLEDA